MGHYTSKDMAFRIDSSTGVLTAISGSVNSQSLSAAMTILDDSGMGENQHTQLYGMINAQTIALNGMLNSTTEGIFGPLVEGTGTSKTVEFKSAASKFYTGEMLVQDVAISGSPDTIETWSCNLTAENGLNRTSVAV
jgi:hypothetical protein